MDPSDAMAWLSGAEGKAVADLLSRSPDGASVSPERREAAFSFLSDDKEAKPAVISLPSTTPTLFSVRSEPPIHLVSKPFTIGNEGKDSTPPAATSQEEEETALFVATEKEAVEETARGLEHSSPGSLAAIERERLLSKYATISSGERDELDFCPSLEASQLMDKYAPKAEPDSQPSVRSPSFLEKEEAELARLKQQVAGLSPDPEADSWAAREATAKARVAERLTSQKAEVKAELFPERAPPKSPTKTVSFAETAPVAAAEPISPSALARAFGKPIPSAFQLIDAAIDGDMDELQRLLELNADVNSQDSSGDTALLGACYNGSEPVVVQLLLQAAADPNITNKYGDTALQAVGADGNPLVSTCSRGRTDRSQVLRLLLAAGAIQPAPEPVKPVLAEPVKPTAVQPVRPAAAEPAKPAAVVAPTAYEAETLSGGDSALMKAELKHAKARRAWASGDRWGCRCRRSSRRAR